LRRHRRDERLAVPVRPRGTSRRGRHAPPDGGVRALPQSRRHALVAIQQTGTFMKNPLLYDTFLTPLGSFSIAVDGRGAIAAAVFGDYKALRKCLKNKEALRDPAAVAGLRKQVEDYFAGSRKPFVFKLATEPTPFQGKVWKALQEIPRG